MDEKFELHSKFQLEGVFWGAARPDEKFAGTLSCDGKRLELVTRAELVTPTPAMLMGDDEASVPDIVHGFTVKGDCTIIGLQHIRTPGLLDFSPAIGAALALASRRQPVSSLLWHLKKIGNRIFVLGSGATPLLGGFFVRALACPRYGTGKRKPIFHLRWSSLLPTL